MKSSTTYYSRILQEYTPISKEEEVALARIIQDEKKSKREKEKAKEKLVFSNFRFLIRIVNKYKSRNVFPLISTDDLLQEGLLGMMRAAEKYDPEKNFKFIVYAIHWILVSIENFVFKGTKQVTMGLGNKHQNSILAELSELKHLEENERENRYNLVKKYVVKGEKQLENLESIVNMRFIPGNQPIKNNKKSNDEESTLSIVDCLVSEESPEKAILEEDTRQYSSALLKKALEEVDLTEKEKKVIIRKFLPSENEIERLELVTKERKIGQPTEGYVDNTTIGKELNISRERIRQIKMKALQKLKKYFEEQGIEKEALLNI